ncbi:MAG: protein tyrosine phosphatase [Flavobacteriales bacterium]|nr:protein tyrosine phosphatase [Flavobacteriales bacterium]
MNLLFVCSRNEWRSRTAETIFKNHGQHQVRSAGTASSARLKLNSQMLDWADMVFVMEEKHHDIIRQKFPDSIGEDSIIVLHIPDEYRYMDAELIEELKASVEPYL